MENSQQSGREDIEQHSAAQTDAGTSFRAQAGRELDLESGVETPRLGDTQSSNSWRRRRSISLSRGLSLRLTIEEIASDEQVAEAGDDGGKSLHGGEKWAEENGVGMGVDIPDDVLILSNAFRSAGDLSPYISSAVSPLASDIVSPASEHGLLGGRQRSHVDPDARGKPPQRQPSQTNQETLPCILKYVYILTHLAIFGILGVLIRYGLEILFGPSVAKITNDVSPLYSDLPSNMVGCFFMGWVGVVFKRDISLNYEFLAIGLTTGLMGSITTFTGWIQKMVNLTARGHWVAGFIGLLLGMELAQISLTMGIESAKLLRRIIIYIHNQKQGEWLCFMCIPIFNKVQRRTFSFVILMTIIIIFWGGSIILIILNFRSHRHSKLWWGCLFGPSGVWVRWYMARLNGKGIGRQGHFKWLPVGTLLTNFSAYAFMATLSIINLVVKTQNAKMLIGGLELGFLGCMSTVSTFVTEVRALHQSVRPRRAYAYIALTIVPTFILGTLIYSVPVWTKGY